MSSPARWILGLAIGAGLALNAATFGYVVSIERRLTRLETIDELVRPRPRATLKTAQDPVEVLKPRLAGHEAVD